MPGSRPDLSDFFFAAFLDLQQQLAYLIPDVLWCITQQIDEFTHLLRVADIVCAGILDVHTEQLLLRYAEYFGDVGDQLDLDLPFAVEVAVNGLLARHGTGTLETRLQAGEPPGKLPFAHPLFAQQVIDLLCYVQNLSILNNIIHILR